MTPAVYLLKKAKIKFKLHSYDHDPTSSAYGEEAADRLNISYDRIFKTLVVMVNKTDLMVAVVPVSSQLNMKKFAKAVKAKKTAMADKNLVERTTGYLLGGVSPLAQKKRLPTVIDTSAADFETVYVSAGKRGLQVELAANDLLSQTGAIYADISI